MFIRKMDYTNSLHCRAVVDWIEVEIQTINMTNFQTVQRAFRKVLCLPESINIWVKAHDANEGGGTCRFSVRIQDVTRYSDVEKWLINVSAMLPLSENWLISKMELALDVYCDDQEAMTARLYKFMANPVSDNRRMYHEGRGTPKAVPRHFDSIERHLSEGWQIAIGNKTDNEYQHLYVKDTDTQDGQRHKVEKRARLEIRLSGAALPYQTPEEWQQCKFERMADYFKQRQLKDNLDPLIQTLAEAADQIGERKTRNRREGGTRQYSKATKADPINGAIRQALRDLSKRWASTGKRGRVAKSACGNSGRINEQNPHKQRKQVADSNNYIYEQEEQHDNDNQDQRIQNNNGRNCEQSAESAKPIQTDPTHSALDDLIQSYEATPEAKNEHDRINELMGAVVGDADTPTP